MEIETPRSEQAPLAAAPQAREFIRLDVALEVTLASGHNFWTGLTRNISEGGLFVAVDEPLPEGSVLEFRFRLLPDPTHHEVKGEVRWVRPPAAACDELPAGMGVKFLALTEELSTSIQRFMAHQRDSLFFDCDDLG